MQAIFRPTGDLEIVVSNQAEGVLLEMYEGLDPVAYAHEVRKVTEKCQGCTEMGFGAACTNDKVTLVYFDLAGKPIPERKRALIHLSKQDARSVASAIMGAAASV